MRRSVTHVIAVAILASVAVAAQKALTPEDLDRSMKTLAPASGAMNKAIKTAAWDDARKQVAIVEAALQDAHNFWVGRKQGEAVAMSREALSKIKAVKAALAPPSPDGAAVTTSVRAFASSCLGCHKAYRVQDANQQFVLKPGI
jgi:cytochrome c556